MAETKQVSAPTRARTVADDPDAQREEHTALRHVGVRVDVLGGVAPHPELVALVLAQLDADGVAPCDDVGERELLDVDRAAADVPIKPAVSTIDCDVIGARKGRGARAQACGCWGAVGGAGRGRLGQVQASRIAGRRALACSSSSCFGRRVVRPLHPPSRPISTSLCKWPPTRTAAWHPCQCL